MESFSQRVDTTNRMATIIASNDRYLGEKLAQLARDAGNRPIRSADIARITLELKKPGTLVVLDMDWEPIQAAGVLRQLVNVGKITGNRVVCICPNADEKLKALAKSSGCYEWFIRYDLETSVRDFLIESALVKKKEG